MENKKKIIKIKKGKVVSDKSDKTIVVLVPSFKKHANLREMSCESKNSRKVYGRVNRSRPRTTRFTLHRPRVRRVPGELQTLYLWA